MITPATNGALPMSDKFKLNEQLTKDALDYHRLPPGKTQVVSTKPVATQRRFISHLFASVAAPCLGNRKDLKLLMNILTAEFGSSYQ